MVREERHKEDTEVVGMVDWQKIKITTREGIVKRETADQNGGDGFVWGI